MKIISSLAALLACCGTAGLAQQTPTKSIDVNLNVQLAYDSNVLRGNGAGVGGRGRGSDYRLTPSADIDLLYPLGRQAVFLNGNVGYDFYKRSSDLNRERIGLRGGAHLQASRCRSTLEVDYARFQSNFEDVINTSRIKNVEEHRSYSADLTCGGAIGLTPSIGYTRDERDNSDSFRKFDDVRSDTYRASLGYTRPTFGTLSVYGTYRDGRYPNRSFLGSGLSEGIKVYSAGLSYDRRIGSKLQGAVSIGVSKVNPGLPGVKDYKGLSYTGDLTFTPTDRWQAQVGFSRQADQSNIYTVSYSIDTSFHADVTYVLNDRVNLLGGGSYSRNRYRSAAALAGQPFAITPNGNTYRFNGGISFTPRKKLNFKLDGRYQRRDVVAPYIDYTDKQLVFTTSVRL